MTIYNFPQNPHSEDLNELFKKNKKIYCEFE